MKKLIPVCAIILAVAAIAGAQQKHPDPRHDNAPYDLAAMYRHHLTKVNDEFWTGGQPPISELAKLKEAGFKVILDLQVPTEHDVAAEAAEAKRLGMRYVNIPVVYDAPKEEQVTEFLKLTDDPQNRPMFIHCTMAIRASAFWMVRRVLRDGWSVEKAEEEAVKLGLGARHLREFARRYIEKSAKAAPKAQAREPFLVSPSWLIEHFNDRDLVLLQVGDQASYDAAHIPGAAYVNYRDMAAQDSKLALQLPPTEQLKETFEKLGVSDESRIIVYFGRDWWTPTARVFLTLEYLGLGDRTSILDGGQPAWREAGQPVTVEVPEPARGTITLRPKPETIADLAWVSTHLDDPAVAIVDARNKSFYEGTSPGSNQRYGHIRGARSIPFPTVADESGRLKDPAALRELFSAAGVQPGQTVVTYCHIGQQASFVYFAARLLGYEARMYDGSFDEWSQHPELPTEPAKPPTAPPKP